MVRMPGFGLDGPWRDNPAFAYAIEVGRGPELVDRLSRPHPLRAVFDRRPECRRACAQRAAAGAGTPPPHRRGCVRRSGDGRCRAEHLRRTGHRVLGVRGAAGTRRQSRADGRAPEPLPQCRHRRIRPARQLGRHRGGKPTSSGKACAPHSDTAPGRQIPRCHRCRAARTPGSHRRAPRRLVRDRSGDDIVATLWMPACRWPRSCSRIAKRSWSS